MVDHPSHDKLGRRNRMRPCPSGRTIRLTERDLYWMQKLHQHGPLSSSFLIAFGKQFGGNEARAKNRLTDLFNEPTTGTDKPVLTRPLQQFRTIDARYNELAYDLAEAGIKLLKEKGRFHKHTGRSPGPWFHSHMAASITAAIEIETLNRSDLNFISGWEILERAETTMRYPTKIVDPATGRTVTKDLIPDALFGLEYVREDGKYYRFFLVEADRSTEPLTSSNFNRKSWQRTLLQYEEYIGKNRYKEHLNLTAPLLILFALDQNSKTRKIKNMYKTKNTHHPIFVTLSNDDKIRIYSSPKSENFKFLNLIEK